MKSPKKEENSTFDSMQVKVEEIELYKTKLNNPQTAFEGVVAFRKLLSIERSPPIAQVIASGVVPRLVQFLMVVDNPKLQYEACWAITNIASGTSEQTQSLLQFGVVEIFVQLLSSPEEDIREQSVWALGNIAGDSPQCRDFVLSKNVLPALLNLLQSGNNKATMMRNGTWLLSNLCRGKPAPPFEIVSVSLPILTHLLKHPDSEVMTDACWAFSYLTDGNDNQISTVLQTGIAPNVVHLLGHSSFTVQTPALRTVGNIVSGNDKHTQAVLELNVLPLLGKMLQATRKTIKKEAAWCLSNIAASSIAHCQLIVDANVFPQVVKLTNEADFEVKKECVWVISNATTWKNIDQIRYLVALGVIPSLMALLGNSDPKFVVVILEAFENILLAGENSVKQFNGQMGNPFCSVIEDADGIDKIEELQDHENEKVYEKANFILEKFFGATEVDENMTPAITNGNTFSFAMTQPNSHQKFAF